MRAKILSAGPSLMFMVLIRWSSFNRSKACPSISWDRNSSAISWQPAQTATENRCNYQLDAQDSWAKKNKNKNLAFQIVCIFPNPTDD